MLSSIDGCRDDDEVTNGGEERAEAAGGPDRRGGGALSWLEVLRCFESLPEREQSEKRTMRDPLLRILHSRVHDAECTCDITTQVPGGAHRWFGFVKVQLKSRRERLRKARASGRTAAAEACLAQELCAFDFHRMCAIRAADTKAKGAYMQCPGDSSVAGWAEHAQAAYSLIALKNSRLHSAL
ncbi:hypothetical protein AB1Y20_000659 [Prymnesium parvum]|uniref:Uncharacterized protein n=1 Tax=Prymnesium parvum TaxID=97485 RepID=A0AB34K8S2_PRYPA